MNRKDCKRLSKKERGINYNNYKEMKTKKMKIKELSMLTGMGRI